VKKHGIIKNSTDNNQTQPQQKTLKKRLIGVLFSVFSTLAVFIVAQIIIALVLGVYAGIKKWDGNQAIDWVNGSVQVQFIIMLATGILFTCGVYMLLKRQRKTLRSIGWRSTKARYYIGVIGLVVVYFISLIVVTAVVKALIPQLDTEQEQQIGFENASTSLHYLFIFLSLVVIPPITEEILFRGYLFGKLLQSVRFRYAAIITSFVFASLHLQFGSGAPLLWVAAIDTFILSLFLCYIRFKSSSLWPAILLHMIKNAIAFIVLFGDKIGMFR
jgi:membrane protease YdiL (CAAX protease family)